MMLLSYWSETNRTVQRAAVARACVCVLLSLSLFRYRTGARDTKSQIITPVYRERTNNKIKIIAEPYVSALN